MTLSNSQVLPAEQIKSMLKVAEKMDAGQLDELTESFVLVRAKRKAMEAKETEEELLAKAKQDFTPTEKRRYKSLINKRQNDTINEEEMKELWAFIEMSEELTVIRVENVLKLAALKGVPFQVMYDSIGYKKNRNVL